jgi:hypothetical protein
MELNITEIGIPKNNNQNLINQPQTIKPIPNSYAKMVRPKVQEPKPQISYDDILNNMGMVVVDGKLHLVNTLGIKNNEKIEKNQHPQKQQQKQVRPVVAQVATTQAAPENSYIYNKYFNAETETSNVRVPKDVNEYKKMLIQDIIQKIRIKQMKTTKLVLPNTNMNFASNNSHANLNKLFDFSKR